MNASARRYAYSDDPGELVMRGGEEVFSLPFVNVPPRSTTETFAHLQQHFRAKRFCVYADDSTKLRVEITAGVISVGGCAPVREMPVGLFADGPAVDREPFVFHCSRCGAPAEESAPRCRYCAAPLTWRLVETAFGQTGLALDFPTLGPGVILSAKFTSRSDKAIGVDSAFVGVAAYMMSSLGARGYK
jgi:hypothetical protein